MKSSLIREKFINFFTERGHTLVPSSSLIPAQDPTLLFTNAGMNQFKDVFLGKEERSYKRAVSIQKCIRAGGKHNDLDNVGFTKRHLTFFEMMGNFSFGDYFKKDAIRYAWEFLTKYLELPQDKLYASVFYQDEEAYTLWHEDIGLPTERIVRLGAADNFWQMGDTGPCGPCTEIYIDRGNAHGCGQENCTPGCSCDRFLEIWNLVFMQYNRQSDGSDVLLEQKGVDTGMGFERLTAVLQGKNSIFETDIFRPIIEAIEKQTGKSYEKSDFKTKAAFNVLADHIRSVSFALADGAVPSNEGRGYVLRKIIRRAALFAQKLSDKNFFASLVDPLIASMGSIYPELSEHKETIKKIIEQEVERFTNNLTTGKTIFEKYIQEESTKKSKTISGAQAFKLYDTYGFPLEITRVLAHEQGFSVDEEGFDAEMEKQKKQSGKKVSYDEESPLDDTLTTNFIGYESLSTEATVTGLLIDHTSVEEVPAGETCFVITDISPFYVECGGQINDAGYIVIDGAKAPLKNLKKIGKTIAALITAPVPLNLGQKVTLVVDETHRINTMKNHTATHLLQAALIQVLGKQVRQSGSLVTPDYLRFDFTYHESVTPDQIKQVEDIVYAKIMENIPLSIYTTTYKNATEGGVMAIFGEKYNPESVRVIDITGFSKELCGGTHVRATGDIGCFKITELSALSAGNKRIVALTGPKALELFQQEFAIVKTLGQELKVKPAEILEAFKKQRDQLKEFNTQVKTYKRKLWSLRKMDWVKDAVDIKGIPFVHVQVDDAAIEDFREIAQDLLNTKPGIYFLTASLPERAYFFLAFSPEFSSRLDTTKILEWLKVHGFQGGGAKNTMQGSGTYISTAFVHEFRDWLEKNIN